MEAERWQQIERLFQAALERAPSEWAVLLAEACAGDAELRREVESLLAEHARGGSLLETAATDLAADWAQEQKQTTLKQTLGHFRILSLLGKGGMGEVYLAEDLKLHRKVALKLLPHAFASHEDRRQRFEQEARAASALNHPNIVTIYEIDQVEGTHFIATEFVEGQTLRALLNQELLTLTTALDITAQVANALAAAHAAGIIHRDIKPENVMVRKDGLVKVLDFGLAKLLAPASPEVDSQAPSAAKLSTVSGVVMGTPQYMSPEQARGQEVDGRTDVFSLGVLLYELLSGHAPFVGATPSDVIAALLKSEPAPLSSYVPAIPPALEHIVSKAMRKERAERYQTIKDLLVELKRLKQRLETKAEELTVTSAVTTPNFGWRGRIGSRVWLAWAAIIVAVIAGFGSWLLWRGLPTASQPEIRSLAVLPLENLSGDPAQEYFADGMTEALISKLTQIRALSRVISRTSVMRYKGNRSKSLPEIAAELKVDAIIEGTVQRSGGRVLVTTRLIPAAADSPLWSRDYDRDESDVLKLQSEVARAVAAEIRIQVTAEERTRLASARSIHPKAHEAYLLGRSHLSKNNEQDYQQAITHFERATQIAPEYAAAFAGLSDVWLQRGVFGKPFKEIEPHARAAVLQALKLDEQLPEAHISLANLKFYYDWDWTGSEAAFKRALELDPGSLNAHLAYGHLLMCLGRHDEAVEKGKIAEQMDPLSAETQTALGRFLYRARRYEEALPHLQRAVALEPRSIGANFRLADIYVQLGQYAEALRVFDNGRKLTRDDSSFQGGSARVYALMGQVRKARQMISGLKGEPVLVANVYAVLGDKDEAFRILEQAIEEHNSLLVTIKEDPPLDSLHTDPRWKKLLLRMNFPTLDSGK